MKKQMLTVISPHADDAALSLSESLRALRTHCSSIRIISCFTHSAWAPYRPSTTDASSISLIRHHEDLRFANSLGACASIHSLGFVDDPLRSPSEPSSHSAHAPDSPLVSTLTAALLEQGYRGGIWMIPMAIRHPDHLIALWSGLAAAAEDPFVIYEDMPYALSFSSEQLTRQSLHFSLLIKRRLRAVTLTGFDPQRWCDSMGCYPSQFQPEQIENWSREIASRGGERLWCNDKAFALFKQFFNQDPCHR